MPYVMVPVPEEHVEEVMQFMLRSIAKASEEPWDTESMSTLFDDSDELTRTLLSFVARATIKGVEVLEADAAAAVQLSHRETAAIVRELNEQAREMNRANVLVRQPTTQVMPNGRTLEKTALAMDETIAALVQEAERADLAANPLPGTSG
ncbi:MAG: hypothetical protein R2695_13555 [Acidimicrobiales bacterium]